MTDPDNEPDIWHSTHYDIHPVAATYDELWAKTSTWAAGLKTKAPSLVITGPALSSYCNMMFLSNNFGCAAQYVAYPEHINANVMRRTEYINHNNQTFLQWYITQIKSYAVSFLHIACDRIVLTALSEREW